MCVTSIAPRSSRESPAGGDPDPSAAAAPSRQRAARGEHDRCAKAQPGAVARLGVGRARGTRRDRTALWPSMRPAPDVPPALAAYYVRGKINVIEFVDFECPFCRLLHPELKKVVAEYGSRVNFVRLDLPLEMHPNAPGAARAHVCASERGQGDAMADVLFDTDNLEASGLVAAAKQVGLDEAEFKRCLAAPETEAKVKQSERILRDASCSRPAHDLRRHGDAGRRARCGGAARRLREGRIGAERGLPAWATCCCWRRARNGDLFAAPGARRTGAERYRLKAHSGQAIVPLGGVASTVRGSQSAGHARPPTHC